jgi:putative transposase
VVRACRVVDLQRSMWYYQSVRDDTEVIDKLNLLAEKYPTRGFDDYYGKIRNEGLKWNRKRVLRVYRMLGMPMRRKRKRRLPSRIKQPLITPPALNCTWSMDFMSDALTYGRKIRILNVIDDYNREALAIEADFSFPGEKVVKILQEIVFWRGKPKQIRVDNGPEFLSKSFSKWCKANKVDILYIQPGRPMQNAYVERFNRLFREDVLDAYLFEDMNQVRNLSYQWMEDYNTNHPHDALGKVRPWKYISDFCIGDIPNTKPNNHLKEMSKLELSEKR